MENLREELAALSEAELDEIEFELDKLLGAYDCINIIGIGTCYHDDQHPGELMKNYDARVPGQEWEPLVRTPDMKLFQSTDKMQELLMKLLLQKVREKAVCVLKLSSDFEEKEE